MKVKTIKLKQIKIIIKIEQLRFLICVFFQYPSSYLISKINSPLIMQIFNIAIGFLLQIYIFRGQFIISFLATLSCYLCMRFIPNKKLQAYLTFIVSMSFLSGIHIYRMIIDYGNWTLDVNVILMINVCKYSAVAFNYYDSDRDEKECTDYMLRQ